MSKEILFQEPYSSEKIKFHINECLNSNYYSTGSYENKCLEILSKKFSIQNCLITHSATGALELTALYLKTLYPEKKVFLPSYTFSSTANAFLRSGFEIEFLDINPETLMIDIDKELRKIENNILIPVHYAGQSVDFSLIKELKKDTIVVEDAAQGLGSQWDSQQLGTIGNFGAISFHHTKNVQAGFGGLFISKELKDYEKIYHIYERGTDRQKVINGVKSKYEWVELGSSFQIPDILSAILYAQLEDYEIIIQKRKLVYDFYDSYFKNENITTVTTPRFHEKSTTNYHAYVVKFNTNKAASDFIKFTKSEGINCYIGYVPLHTSEMGRKLNLNHKLINTEEVSSRIVRLPLHTNIDEDDLDRIQKVFNNYFKVA